MVLAIGQHVFCWTLGPNCCLLDYGTHVDLKHSQYMFNVDIKLSQHMFCYTLVFFLKIFSVVTVGISVLALQHCTLFDWV